MEIVFLETISLGDDINLDRFDELGHVTKYRDTPVELVPERVKDADVVVINKIPMNEKTLAGVSHLKLVAVTATGMDNIDRAYTDSHGILSANVAGYSTEAVAQHTFALMFYVLHKLAYYDHYVKSGAYCTSAQFSHFEQKFSELDGKTWGIVGMGAIGKRVASHAQEFGCNVIYYSTSGKNTDQLYERVDFEELLKRSDLISVHAPLNPDTRKLFDRAAFEKMKKSAIFINVARGAIVDQEALTWALQENKIAAAALDVLDGEPMREDNPLRQIQDSGKLIITPHIAWAPKETRERLLDGVYENIKKIL